jgi:translation initiation factor IF-3
MRHRQSPQDIAKKKALINYNIKAKEIRLVSENGAEIISTQQGIQMAKQQELDLVCINSKPNPPICKIMDFGKFLYEQKKKQKEQDKKNRANIIETKEIQFRPTIGIGDMMVKVKKIQETINDGDKVKLIMKMRGREIGMKEFCNGKFEEFVGKIENFSYESPPKWLGNKVLAILKKSVIL